MVQLQGMAELQQLVMHQQTTLAHQQQQLSAQQQVVAEQGQHIAGLHGQLQAMQALVQELLQERRAQAAASLLNSAP